MQDEPDIRRESKPGLFESVTPKLFGNTWRIRAFRSTQVRICLSQANIYIYLYTYCIVLWTNKCFVNEFMSVDHALPFDPILSNYTANRRQANCSHSTVCHPNLVSPGSSVGNINFHLEAF